LKRKKNKSIFYHDDTVLGNWDEKILFLLYCNLILTLKQTFADQQNIFT